MLCALRGPPRAELLLAADWGRIVVTGSATARVPAGLEGACCASTVPAGGSGCWLVKVGAPSAIGNKLGRSLIFFMFLFFFLQLGEDTQA